MTSMWKSHVDMCCGPVIESVSTTDSISAGHLLSEGLPDLPSCCWMAFRKQAKRSMSPSLGAEDVCSGFIFPKGLKCDIVVALILPIDSTVQQQSSSGRWREQRPPAGVKEI